MIIMDLRMYLCLCLYLKYFLSLFSFYLSFFVSSISILKKNNRKSNKIEYYSNNVALASADSNDSSDSKNKSKLLSQK